MRSWPTQRIYAHEVRVTNSERGVLRSACQAWRSQDKRVKGVRELDCQLEREYGPKGEGDDMSNLALLGYLAHVVGQCWEVGSALEWSRATVARQVDSNVSPAGQQRPERGPCAGVQRVAVQPEDGVAGAGLLSSNEAVSEGGKLIR
jgi:hypothetical protein